MLMPSIFGEDLLDELMNESEFDRIGRQMNKKLFGHHAKNLMKVDVKENEQTYEMCVDLPGFKKDEISAKIENGYLIISASKHLNENEKDQETGNYIRKERYFGSSSRSFYVGEDIQQEDVKAKFEDGVLRLSIPKVEAKQSEIENHKYICIE